MLIEDIAKYAVAERDRPLPDGVFHHAKRTVIDWCATTAPGSVEQPATGLVRAMADDVGRGKARLFPSGQAATLRGAAVINAAASHTVEFDDIFRDAIYHPGTPVISTALAAAEAHDLSGEELLRAIIVGYEVSTRIAAVMGRPHYKYWHMTATNGTFGAAAAMATVLRLDEEQFANALTTGATMAAGLQQSFRSFSHSKPMHGAHAADSGILSALAASAGTVGAKDILEGEVGYGVAMSRDCDWSKATEGLGEVYNITRMTIKNHGCCGHTFAAIDAGLELRNNQGLDWKDVESIRVGGYSATVDVCSIREHATPFEGKFNLAYVVAHGLKYGSVRLDAFSDERLNDPDLKDLIDKTELYLDQEVDAGFPGMRAAKIKVKTKDGRVLSHFQKTRKGDPDQPLTDSELEGKYTELVGPVAGEAAAARLLEALWKLETLDSVHDLPIGGDAARRAAE